MPSSAYRRLGFQWRPDFELANEERNRQSPFRLAAFSDEAAATAKGFRGYTKEREVFQKEANCHSHSHCHCQLPPIILNRHHLTVSLSLPIHIRNLRSKPSASNQGQPCPRIVHPDNHCLISSHFFLVGLPQAIHNPQSTICMC
jgi:hypothetical protein